MSHKGLYDFYKQNGICVSCGQNNAAKGRVRCFECLEKNSESSRKRIRAETDDERTLRLQKNKEYKKNLYSDRKSNGLCVFCGKTVCKKSNVYCIDHYIKNQRKNNKRNEKTSRQLRVSMGLCISCGKDSAIDGKKLCKQCYDTRLSNLEKANRSPNTLLHRDYIKNLNNLIFNN